MALRATGRLAAGRNLFSLQHVWHTTNISAVVARERRGWFLSWKELEPEAITSTARREADFTGWLLCCTVTTCTVASSKHPNDLGSRLVASLRSVEGTVTGGFQKWPMHLTRVPVKYKHSVHQPHHLQPWSSHHEQAMSPNDGFCFLLPTIEKKKKLSAFSGFTEAPAAGGHVPVGPPPTQWRKGSLWGRWGTHPCYTPQAATQPALLSHTKQEKIRVCHSAEPQHYEVSWGLQTFKEERNNNLSKCNQRKTTKNPYYSKLKTNKNHK